MPYVSESRYADLLKMENAVSDVRSHVNAWIRLLENHVAGLPADTHPTPQGEGCTDRSYAEHELRAMRRDLGALFRS